MKTALTGIALATALTATPLTAQEVTLRMHTFLPPASNFITDLFAGLEERIEADSEGRIDLQIYPAMQLGGTPGDLYDQAADGAVDIVMTLPGYTPGRFNQIEVFELPFMMTSPEATARAAYGLVADQLQDGEFDETKILATWVHGPGVIHTNTPVNTLEDLAGLEMRGPTRIITDLLGELGATPVGMPLPAIPENLSKGVIDGAVVPWEIVPAIKLQELVGNHTEISANR